MSLKNLTDGRVSGTGTVNLQEPAHVRRFGGAMVSTDGSNAVVVVVRLNDGSGEKVFDVSTVSPGLFAAPFSVGNAGTLHYSISGTGGSAILYEWVK